MSYWKLDNSNNLQFNLYQQKNHQAFGNTKHLMIFYIVADCKK